MRPLWGRLWRLYDTPLGARLLPGFIAPWLLGKALGSKGRRVA